MSTIINFKSISEFHAVLGLEAPEHPLISLIEDLHSLKDTQASESLYDIRLSCDMYAIMYKDKISGSLGYGRNSYDFQEGTLIFSSPGQVFTTPKKEELEGKSGWTLLFHPDLLAKSTLSLKMDDYNYFSYEVTEALHLSKKEEAFIFQVVDQIKQEYSQNLDTHSQNLILSNLELLLNYCMRYYDRQFFTRTNFNNDYISKFELELKRYFKDEKHLDLGIPHADYFGAQLSMSGNYLSDMLKKETGKGIKEHIDNYIIRQAKKVLLNSSRSVSEIAYGLGFDYPQSFTRLFKKKVGMGPAEYRSLN